MKRIIAMLLTVLMVFSLCACGQSPAPAESPANSDSAPAAEPEAPAAEEPQDYDYSGQKLIIWTCLTADAQYEVSVWYTDGVHCVPDYQKSVFYCTRAAMQGHEEAIEYLEVLSAWDV